MKPSRFDYHRPGSVVEVTSLLAEREDEDAKIIAGGQSLVPMMNLRLARPGHLVDVRRVPGLRGIRATDDRWDIGALTTHTDVLESRMLRQHMPLLPAIATDIAYQQIRNRGTVGGSLCHADPVAEWPMAMTLLDATMHVEGPGGPRRISAGDFFVSVFTSALAPDEMLTRVTFDRFGPGWTWGFSEFARKAGEFAIVAVAVLLRTAGQQIHEARIAMAGAGSTPLRAAGAEARLAGADTTDAGALSESVAALAEEVEPPEDTHATSDYRGHLLAVEAERALSQALSRTSGR